MQLTTSLLLASSLVGVATAAPRKHHNSTGLTFSVQQIPKNSTRRGTPAQEVAKTYKKLKKAAPASVAAASGQSGTVTASDTAYDVEYVCPVTIGNQTFYLDLDTGSADLWVFSEFMSANQETGHTVYVPSSSATLLSGETFSIGYGDGSGASGIVYADKVVVGGVTATSQAVEAATSASKAFVSDTSDSGLMGLGFSNINTVSPTKQTTFFDSVKSSLAAQLFTSNLKAGAAGTYDFGFIDTTKYKGAISYVDVNSASGYWEFTAGVYAVGKVKYTTAIGTSIADTGTTLLYLPSSVCEAYYAKVTGATYSNTYGGYVFPNTSKLPPFHVTLGTKVFTIPASSMVFGPMTSSLNFGALQPNTGIGFSIFGDTFLKNAFVVWDQTQSTPRLGFAKQAS